MKASQSQAAVRAQKRENALARFAKRFFTVQNVLLGVGWLAWLVLLVYVQTQTKDLAPFDPYEILKACCLNLEFLMCSCMHALLSLSPEDLREHVMMAVVTPLAVTAEGFPCTLVQLERGASDREVKKAFRQLSLIFHPDKNPDPAAAIYFRDSISKAYKALTGAQATSAQPILDRNIDSPPCMDYTCMDWRAPVSLVGSSPAWGALFSW